MRKRTDEIEAAPRSPALRAARFLSHAGAHFREARPI